MRVVGYVRVSTDEQARHGVSLAAQETKLRGYAALYDLTVVEVVTDDGQSAKTLDRPGLRRVMEMLDRREVEGLLVAKLDRLTRSVVDLASLIERYFGDRVKRPLSLQSVGEQVDTRSAAGRMVLNVLVSIAQWERETIAERTRDAMQHLRRQGVRLGPGRFGERRAAEAGPDRRRAFEPVADEAATVAMIRALSAQGMSVRRIAQSLDEQGRRTKLGKRWHSTTVQRVLARGATT